MADRYLKHKTTGLVLIYAQPWISDPDFEECADAKGNPIPVNPAQPTYVKPEADKGAKPKASKPKAKADTEAEAALRADATRRL